MTEVYINSKFIGEIQNPREFVDKLREARRKGDVSTNTNVYFNETTEDVLRSNIINLVGLFCNKEILHSRLIS